MARWRQVALVTSENPDLSGGFLWYNETNGGAIGNLSCQSAKRKLVGGNNMFGGGLQPYQLNPINRGCVNKLVFVTVRKANCDAPETQVDRTNKRLFLTVKTRPWDDVADDSDATFKVEGVIPNPAKEPGRVVFTLSEQDTYKDPTIPYFCDIVETDSDGTSNANRLFIGTFNILPGPNNKEAGGEA